MVSTMIDARLSRRGLLACAGMAGLVAAAARANHPTPLVGYGGSAVVGYLLSLIALPTVAPAHARKGPAARTQDGTPPDASALFAIRIRFGG